MFFTHFFHYFYIPTTGPWYSCNVWGNLFVIAVIGPLGWLWSKTKYWPLKPIAHGIRHLHTKMDALHAKHDKNHAELMAQHKALQQQVQDLHAKHDDLHAKLAHSLMGFDDGPDPHEAIHGAAQEVDAPGEASSAPT